MRLVLLASGTGTLAQAIIDAEKSQLLDCEISALISDRDSNALKRAQDAGIRAEYLPMQPDRKVWELQLANLISALKVDLVVSVGFMRVLSAEFVAKFPTINTHPSLLPKFPGAHGVRDALASGDIKTGATVHWVDAEVDTGEIISQREVPIYPADDESSLHERIKIVERSLIVETLTDLIKIRKMELRG
ncbi:MAG: phosphoribosylglycinamide formyltransferase [SAR202 cluster bacterium]|nr:phosphoribosylglycinamide formyltransferase [SAR202 cluster bacterium]